MSQQVITTFWKCLFFRELEFILFETKVEINVETDVDTGQEQSQYLPRTVDTNIESL